MMKRGVQAYKEQAAEASDRRSSGFADILLMKSGQTYQGRFRGLFRLPAHQLNEAEVLSIWNDSNWRMYYLVALGLPVYDSADAFIAAVKKRYTQVEPIIYEQHYCHGVKGRDAYSTCADRWEPRMPCAFCWAKDNGDGRVSLRTQNVFTFHPRNWYHKIESRQKGGKAQYLDCPAVFGEACAYCAQGHEAKQVGVKYLSLADMHAAGVVACEERVQKRCGVCGIGLVRHVGWTCSNPTCGEPLSGYQQLVPPPEGYDPRVVCSLCHVKMVPEEVVACTKKCEGARRCQLHEVDVLVQRTGEGKSTTYQFTEQWPAEPLPAEMLERNLPNYEFALRPRALNEQIRVLGLVQNPFTGEAVNAGQSSAYETEPVQGSPYGESDEEQSVVFDDNIPF